MMGEGLTKYLGQSVIIDNKAGAGGTIGSKYLIRMPADGYTLSMNASGPLGIAPHIFKEANYDPRKDFTPIMYLAASPQVVVVPLSSPAKTMPELIDYIRKNPGKLNFGSAGTGGIPHLSTERFLAMTGTKMTHVPYKGTALAMPDLMAGRLDLMFDSISVSLPHIRDGKVRALAVTSPKPSSVAPDIPTLSQFVPGYESLTWFGVFGPAGLPPAIQGTLNQALNKAIQNPALLAQFAKLGFDAAGGTPAEFAQKMADETVMWRKVITDGNITIEK
jgi:tripartite-type tricarboxylate transporter receptor subunit TctC